MNPCSALSPDSYNISDRWSPLSIRHAHSLPQLGSDCYRCGKQTAPVPTILMRLSPHALREAPPLRWRTQLQPRWASTHQLRILLELGKNLASGAARRLAWDCSLKCTAVPECFHNTACETGRLAREPNNRLLEHVPGAELHLPGRAVPISICRYQRTESGGVENAIRDVEIGMVENVENLCT